VNVYGLRKYGENEPSAFVQAPNAKKALLLFAAMGGVRHEGWEAIPEEALRYMYPPMKVRDLRSLGRGGSLAQASLSNMNTNFYKEPWTAFEVTPPAMDAG
jgi:hypothetical protein